MTTTLTDRLVAHAMAALTDVPSADAARIAHDFAFEVAALRPGAVVETDRGFVRHDSRRAGDPDPYVGLDWAGVRYSRRALGEFHDVRDDVPAYLAETEVA